MAPFTDASPLAWPEGWPRTKFTSLIDGRHKFSKGTLDARRAILLSEAKQSLQDAVNRLGCTSVVVSCDLPLSLRGNAWVTSGPRSQDAGVAISFMRGGKPLQMARDAFYRIEDNMRSLALALEHLSGVERHGGNVIMERAFSGFVALPAPGKPKRPWHVVFGLVPGVADKETIGALYRVKAKNVRDDAELTELNVARDDALASLHAMIAQSRT